MELRLEEEYPYSPGTIALEVYNGTQQTFECGYPQLERSDNGIWYTLKTPLLRGMTLQGYPLHPGETITYDWDLRIYGLFLREGLYRVVLPETAGSVIAAAEFSIS